MTHKHPGKCHSDRNRKVEKIARCIKQAEKKKERKQDGNSKRKIKRRFRVSQGCRPNKPTPDTKWTTAISVSSVTSQRHRTQFRPKSEFYLKTGGKFKIKILTWYRATSIIKNQKSPRVSVWKTTTQKYKILPLNKVLRFFSASVCHWDHI